ncbi:hypothetical protein NBZ79_11705 [Sneathiella marina]|uniref:Flagellar basal-body protein FlbY n=1 Tax=Sneathiella marina TaxID=2950108 RepID=A0ABY4VYR8_9PROT|nr:hypothetical protein [Sneathiella marina]USG59842.1 hypothetical protein NBZ79_11705 [Sneathiella marina]
MNHINTSGPQLLTPSELLKVIMRLREILEEENTLLAENKPEAFSENLGEKTRLVGQYNQQMTLIKNNPERYRAFPKAEIDLLKEASEAFYRVLDAHFRKLSTVKTVTEGLVKSVADEVVKKKSPKNGYTANAALSTSSAQKNSQIRNGAIAINQVI